MKLFIRKVFFIVLVIMCPTIVAGAIPSYTGENNKLLPEVMFLISRNKFKEALNYAAQAKDRYLVKAIKFLYYSDPNSNASFEDIISFIQQNPNYPDRDSMRLVAENKINESTNKTKLIAWCSTNIPRTGLSAHFCLIHSLYLKNKSEAQIAHMAKLAWTVNDYTRLGENEFLDKYGKFLSVKDHSRRINYMLANRKKLSGGALESLDSHHKQLSKIKLRLILHHKRLDTNSSILEDVASHLKQDPYLLYWQALWYSKHEDIQKLKELLLKNQNVPETKTSKWFKIRSLAVWNLCDLKDYKAAYAIAAAHQYMDPVNYVDGEWLAGKVAYNYLKDPQLALKHFKNILDKAQYSPSVARGAYWSGVASQDLQKPKEAIDYFKQASRYVDTFYGQLAVMQLNNNKKCHHELNALADVTVADRQWFETNELLIVGHILAHMHRINVARKFVQAALNSADTAGKKYLIAGLGQHVDSQVLSTISGKEAARRGLLRIKHAYPLLNFKLNGVTVEPALVHAIIRQESEFNATARSSVGASGLMQLMYATAREVGYKIRHPVTKHGLLNPKDNITLGSNYIQYLLELYDGYYILAIAAYNAGPKPINDWIKKYGDPRKLKTIPKVVAWIENIPFSETRGYVQNVLSNLQLYRNLMSSKISDQFQTISLNLGRDLVHAK